VVWWCFDVPKEDRPQVQFTIWDTWEEAMEERASLLEACSWETSEVDHSSPYTPESMFIRPVAMESGDPLFDDAEWVVIELDPRADDEQKVLAMFHTYDNLGNIPGHVIMQLRKRSPHFLLASYDHSDVGFTFGAIDLARPVLCALRAFITKFVDKKS
jgi:hypothetical protein